MGISGYSDVFNLGHKALEHLFTYDEAEQLVMEEKIDGSQFSFGLIDGELQAKSHHQALDVYNTADSNMFRKALDTVIELKDYLTPNYIYRAEYLSKPRHNGLAYDRVPNKNLIIYDIDKGNQNYLSYDQKKREAERLGLEVVERFFVVLHKGIEAQELLSFISNKVSALGGQKIEGIVIKNYSQYAPDKKVLMGKYVSEEFKEVQRKNWKLDNPTNKDIITQIGEELKTEARWNKAIIHLREQGLLKDSPEDIGLLMKEVNADILKEEKENIQKRLLQYAWKKISGAVVRGLPEWYKNKLLEQQFGPSPIAEYVKDEEFKKALDKVIKDHDETLRKLADNPEPEGFYGGAQEL